MFNLATKTITYKSVEWQTENVILNLYPRIQPKRQRYGALPRGRSEAWKIEVVEANTAVLCV